MGIIEIILQLDPTNTFYNMKSRDGINKTLVGINKSII
jgi:hypothetical protein